MALGIRAGAIVLLFYASTAFSQITFTFTGFDPPESSGTYATTVNNGGTVAGYFLDATTNLYVGFERNKAGVFGKPIANAGDNLYVTGLNDSGVISGYYFSTGQEVSFTLSKGVYTDFAYDGFPTQVDRINDGGDLAGSYIENATLHPAFLHSAANGTTTSFSVPGAGATFAEGLNKNDVIVGEYTTIPYSTYQVFIRTAAGKISRFSFPGAQQTYAQQINDCGVIAGSFVDAAGAMHGYYGMINHFTEVDYPGAISTSIDGINNFGELAGSYVDTGGVRHGMVAAPSASTCHLTDHIAFMGTDTAEFGVVDLDTGVFSTLGSTGQTLAGMVAANGVLYGTSYHANTGTLYTIDPANGSVTTVGITTVTYDDFGGTTTGLYAVGTDASLYSVNPLTGATTLIGPTGLTLGSWRGLSNSSPELYFANGPNLYTLNTTTGAATLVGPMGGGVELGVVAAVGGILYGGAETPALEVVTLNATTGAATLVHAVTGATGHFYGFTPYFIN